MSIQVKNLHKINADLDKLAEQLFLEVVTVQKKLAFDIFSDIVGSTPVDTGRAMNNWNISVNSPDNNVTEEGGDESAIESAKEAEAHAALIGLPPFSTVWISNSLPYITFLNEGSSIQAPSQFVETSILNNLGAVL